MVKKKNVSCNQIIPQLCSPLRCFKIIIDEKISAHVFANQIDVFIGVLTMRQDYKQKEFSKEVALFSTWICVVEVEDPTKNASFEPQVQQEINVENLK
ncbi:hypothetical protein UFOVP255_32 [uncultured Caudovirales phage]|uniref:Uncharacterized protein n=1 Tax=uncultured Caudovirales phage TaxID=2100421 RepID=A0A6J5LEH4_9CAUD|nr:hypothetical protein UFOVP255_32 [uncultured Caudovirales phage]